MYEYELNKNETNKIVIAFVSGEKTLYFVKGTFYVLMV